MRCSRAFVKNAPRFILLGGRRKLTEEDEQGVEFNITPDSLENVKKAAKSSIPKFKISGKIHRNTCMINNPFTGEIKVEEAESEIDSVELQLVRVETVSESLAGGGNEEMTTEKTEVSGERKRALLLGTKLT